jgi:hypothetical protein
MNLVSRTLLVAETRRFVHQRASDTLMQGLAACLRKKVGKELEILETWVGNTKVENQVLS